MTITEIKLRGRKRSKSDGKKIERVKGKEWTSFKP